MPAQHPFAQTAHQAGRPSRVAPPWLAPSLLAANAGALGAAALAAAAGGADWLHVDVMDGHFVPNLSFGPATVAALSQAVPLALDVHLMVQDPRRWIAPFAEAGAHMLTFHVEANGGEGAAVAETLAQIRAAGVRVGMSLQPNTPPQQLLPWLDQLDLVLVMSVMPGFGGQAFLPEALATLTTLARAREAQNLTFVLQVDGGITPTTAPAAHAAGADALVAGSAVFADRAAAPHDLERGCRERLAALRGACQTPKG